jgi:hypothetical protein
MLIYFAGKENLTPTVLRNGHVPFEGLAARHKSRVVACGNAASLLASPCGCICRFSVREIRPIPRRHRPRFAGERSAESARGDRRPGPMKVRHPDNWQVTMPQQQGQFVTIAPKAARQPREWIRSSYQWRSWTEGTTADDRRDDRSAYSADPAD